MENTLVISTNNKGKLSEISQILSGSFEKILTLADVGLDIEVEETGETFLENALLKAETVCRLCGLPTLADDSGLEVTALGGAPGVYSARYSGEPCDHKRNNEKLLSALSKASDRTASFTSVVVLYYPNGTYVFAEGKATGTILSEPRGESGFGYDPVFLSDDLGITFAEATAEQKNSVSHRGRALHNLLEKLV